MILSEFLQEISIKGWKLWNENGRLRYRAPNNEATSAVLEQLQEYKIEILNLLEEQPNLLEVYPLSHGQQALWFLWQLAPESPAYNVAFSCRICSDLDVAALQKVFEVLTERHPILRSTFPRLGTEPIQQINLEQAVDFQQIDATNGSESELKEEVCAAYKSPFDLERGPIMRVRLFTRSQQEHILLLVIHHIAGEGWSIGILLNELKVLYPAFRTGQEATLPPPVHSHQHVRWQKTIIDSAEGGLMWDYWQQQLAGELPVLNLPTDRIRPSVQTYNGASYPLYLSETLTQQLKELAQSESTTLYTILLAAFKVLLHHYTDQDDILVGSPTASRHRPEFTQIVGYLVNPVVLRANLSGNPSFREFLAQVRKTVIAAIAHQDYPFALIVKRLQPLRDSSRSIIFQASFVLQKLQQTPDVLKLYSAQIGTTIKWGGLVLEPYEVPQQEGQFDLDLEMMEGSSSVVGALKYNTDLFDGSTIERMAGHFHNLLSAIVENPQQAVGELPLLSAAERHQLLTEWNDTATEYPTDKCIHQLFESQVEKTPHNVAVVFENQQLTYQQLNQKANQLAHHLLSLGVGPEVLVGICVERSVEMVVGLLGILKAGGAYVPLDPTYPQERLSYMFVDLSVQVLLTQQELLSSLPSHTAQVVCLDTDWGTIEQHSQENFDVRVCSDNLAYVIYTSGSTGLPKGVLVAHRNLVNAYFAWEEAYQLKTEARKHLQMAGFSFDVFGGNLVRTLCSAGKLVLCPIEYLLAAEKLYELMLFQEIDCAEFVPAVVRNLMEYLYETKQDLSFMQVMIVGSDSWYIEEHKQLRDLCNKKTRFINSYGVTEATVDSCYFENTCTKELYEKLVPIGNPFANSQIYILDKHLQPVPIGVVGELHIGGASLARGYLNRPELTIEKFIPNPFSDAKSQRLYKTGDLARYLSDGNIEYIGRIDQQVKIRGFRIELGEIEAVLNNHPQIQQAVVIATVDIPGNKRLVAYVVSENESLSTHKLREFLKSKLPEYMVPAVFVTLDTIPLTANGKVDRLALPTPDGEISREQEYVAPRTAIEQILTNIWQELLLIEKVSIHDNFFEIGGDSILSIQIVSRAKNSGVQITPKQIFQNQTIAELAKVANTTVSVTAQQGIVTGVAPLTPIQHWFFEQNRPEAHHYNQSVLLQIPNALKSKLIETALEKLLEHHDALRLRFTSVASEHQQINQSKDDSVPFTIVDLSSTPKLEQPQALSKIATVYQASLNLSTGPIMQVVRFNLGDESDARLLMIIHHLAVDGVSWRIFLSDLETIYQQLIAEQPIQLSAKTTAFIDWAKKLNNYAQSKIFRTELDYWLKQPWSLTKPLPLDYDRIKPENTVGSAASVSVKLSVEETRALLLSVNEAYNTQINDILLSALVVSLAGWTENSTVLINLEGHGREELFSDVDLSRTVGWFTSVFPVLLQLPPINQPAKIIKSIKEQLRAIPNRGIGYGIWRYLCKDTTVQEQFKTIPTPEIIFNYLGQFDQVQSQTAWKFATESTGANQSYQQTRDHLLDINALVVEGEFQINWNYSSQIHSSATVEKLAQSYLNAIRSIIEHCQLEDARGYTPSDFPDAQLNQLELDELLAPIKTKNIDSIYPLSAMQQGMLFHSLYAPLNGVYFEQMTWNLKGNVNVAALASAWQKVVDRHSVLRTFFVWENRPNPLQVVLQQVKLPWNNLNWRELSTTEQQQQLSELLSTQRRLGFQLNQAPLMGCTLIQLTHDTYKFIWNHHHILMDGWCLSIIFKEVLSFYEAEVRGETCDLLTPRPYRDYIAWLNAQDKEAATEFWQQTLQGFSAPTPLVVDKTQYQNQQQDSDYLELELRLSGEVSRKLQSVAQEHHVTLSTIVQAAWGLLLSRYSGEQDVVFGVTVSGRTGSLPGVENMVGLLINTLPLRLQISPQEQLIPTLVKIQQLMLELQHYSYSPLVDIQAWSDIPGGIPLFESIVVFENYPFDSSLLNVGGLLHLSEIEGFEQTNYPLTVVAVPGDELLVKISYDTARFESDTIGRMLGHLQTIFSTIAENPQLSVGELPLLSAVERDQLLVEWNDTSREYPTDKCIHQLFEEQVEKTPDAVAVVFENQQLTYLQLNTRANQLADYLLSVGVKAEVLVGICVERSVEMLVGLLGILKAGGAYLPLDPTYPQERLSYMLVDSGVEVLLTQNQLVEDLPKHEAVVVCLDTDWHHIAKHSEKNLITQIISNNLAYSIYTSGSTGKPKGVQILHSAVVNFLCTMRQQPGMTADEVLVGVTTFNFDMATLEIFLPMIVGARLVMAKREVTIDGQQLLDLLINAGVTVMQATPATWRLLLEAGWQNSHQLKILCGGEALPQDLANQLLARSTSLWNLYGPTETTIWSLISRVEFQSKLISIGRPIANTQVYILDKHLQPVPLGVTGELHIGGAGLARGYLNRPELTIEKFIPNPFSDAKSQRLYKTGDLARYLSDGNIEYIGRIDQQVKIRGFRIELGEIETVLNTHPQIQQAVVIAIKDIPGNKRLVAYVVAREETLSTKQLRELLKSKLPEYMVPSAFVTLDTLPLTANGKIDHLALPTPDREITREQEYIAPRTPSEEIIANIFTTVLNVQNVSINDNFFTLGGHSLLATQLISRLRLVFGREIPLSFAQERLWFLQQLEGASATYNMPFSVRIDGHLDLKTLEKALSEIVRRHSVLRTTFPTVNGTPIQVIHPPVTMKINVVDLQQLEATERENVIHKQAQQQAITPFDLEIAPLIRCNVLQLSARRYVLLLVIHHIVSDGWSIGVFIQELSSLYQALSVGESSPLPELAIQYADFAVWQRQWLSGEVRHTHLNYWRSQLHGAPELLQLSTDRPRPVVQTYQGHTHNFTFNTDLTQKLQTLSLSVGTTLFMTLQAAFSTLLYRYSGQSDILVGTPIANRNRSEIEPLMGFFVNTLVLRTTFEENPNFKSLLAQVRETTLQAYEHQDVPFEQVVEALQPQRSLSHSPLFQVMFVWQNAPQSKVELPGVTLTQLNTESTIAKFDLTLSMSETDQGLLGSWEYNTDLFDGSTIERMATHFQNLCSAMVENPQVSVDEIPLLSAAERHQLLVTWNDTGCEYPTDKCIHQLFEEQVEKTPDAVAVVFENQQLTYLQLNTRANQLADYLLSVGVKAEVLVGICTERSLEMVVGLLGILKAGGAYVPLDPTYPQERLSYMFADSQLPILLTQRQLLEKLPQHQAQTICLDEEDWQNFANYSDDNPCQEVKSDNLAYIIYTSGSTGKPKGTMILHRGMVNYLSWCTTAYNVATGVGSTVNSSIAFDATITSIFSPLLVGRKVVLLPEEGEIELLKAALCSGTKLSLVKITPAHLEILSHLFASEPVNLQTQAFIIGGEALSEKVTSFWLKHAAATRLINEYGPTETVVGCCIYEVGTQTFPGVYIPIGRPISNTELYILDHKLQPVPIGVVGELHIGGASLARGYLNRPELTIEKFIPNPFSDAKSQRLYKTGDLARYLSDGNIEYIGRIDQQVKIRGFRIELGEIEAVLNNHPQIQQAVVIATVDIPGNKRLVAYVVSENESLSTHKLREFLKSKLPEYMVPAVFVTLDTLPLTANGKVDRLALPAPDGEITREQEYIAPRTAIELQLAQIWSSILNITSVGVQENFFELGGNSLLVVKLLSQLRQAYRVDLPVHCLFEFPTVAGIAQVIEKILQLGISNGITDNILDLSAEAVLDSEIQSQLLPFDDVSEPKCIFLTGATGFVGTYLLYELLQRTTADIYCLVRAPNPDEGKKRLQTKLESYSLWDESFSSRIISVLGDLSQPHLGVTAAEFQNLASCIDVI